MANSVDREIKITASDTGVADRLSRLKEGALALGRGIAEDAKKQATSSRELIKLMNEEISLIEKKNRLNKEQRELAARQKPGNTGVMGKPSLKKDLEKISLESKEDKLQTDLLKQILEATLRTSKDEISADRESVRRKISSDKEIDTMEDHEQALKETFQKQMLKDTDKEDVQGASSSQRALDGLGQFVRPGDMYSMGLNTAGGYMHKRAARSENRLASSMMQVGGIAALTAGMGISAASDYYSGIDEIAEVTGVAHPRQYDQLHKGTDLTKAQSLKRGAAFIKSSGGTVTNPTEMNRMLALETGFGINAETLGRTRRFSQDGTAMEAAGAGRMLMTDKDTQLHRSRTEELLQLQLEMTEKQFMSSGEGSAIMNTAIIARIMSGQQVKDVGRARKAIGQLDSIVQGGGQYLEALKFSEFQKATGGSYFDYELEKEKGVSGIIDDVTIKRILESGESDDQKKTSLLHMGLSASVARDIVSAGGVYPKDLEKFRKGAGAAGELAAQETITGGVGVNPVAESSAAVTNALALLGEATVETTKKILNLGDAADDTSIKQKIAKLGSSNVSADGTPSTSGPKY